MTGTDEFGSKIAKKAKDAGKEPQEYVDEMVVFFKELCKKLNISNDRFIRTTEAEHIKVTQDIFKTIYDKGDIYLGNYSGWYCSECETFYTEKDLKAGCCPTHEKKAEWISEESYFFKLSAYTQTVLDYFEKNLESVQPSGKRKEMINRAKGGLKDLSVSRVNVPWGIPVPMNKKHTIYVWVGALLNYVSGVNYPKEKFKKFWPANIHLIGSDIIFHHSCIWYSLLSAAGIPLPKTVFVHGFINTASGDKMSKSKGTVIDPVQLADKYGSDILRYFLLREIPFGQDGNFSEEALKERLNNELANELGNLVNRSIVMIENAGGKIPDAKTDTGLQKKLRLDKIKKMMEKHEPHHAIAEIFSFAGACNQFINEKEPWKLKGKQKEAVLYSLADSLRIIAILIQPFIPTTAEKINQQLGVKAGLLSDCEFNKLKAGTKVKKGGILFKKIE